VYNMSMLERDHLSEARRWAKFPATLILISGILWLLQRYFELDWPAIGEQTRTGLGSAAVFVDLVAIPLGSMVTGVGLLFIQRWAIWMAFFLPLMPLLMLGLEKWIKICDKFSTFHRGGDASSFGAGVMGSILVLGLAVVYFLLVIYLIKCLKHINSAASYSRGKAVSTDSEEYQNITRPSVDTTEDQDVCLLLPDPEQDSD